MIKQQKGFTLVEVLIALAIFVVASVALDSAINSRVLHYQQNIDRTLATWIASNQLVSAQVYAPKADRKSLEYADRKWLVETIITPTDRAGLNRIEVKVFPDNNGNDNPAAVAGLTSLLYTPVAPPQ